MRIECLPARSPLRGSRRLPGGDFRASRKPAASTMISFRRATLARSSGNPFGTLRPSRIGWANFPRKLLIIGHTYLIEIRMARAWYPGKILPASAAPDIEAEAFSALRLIPRLVRRDSERQARCEQEISRKGADACHSEAIRSKC